MPNTRAFTRYPSRRLLVVAQTLHLPLPTPRRSGHPRGPRHICLPHESLRLWSPLAKHISRVFLLWLFPSLVIIFVVYFICLLLCVLFVVVLEKKQTVLMHGQGIIFSVFAAVAERLFHSTICGENMRDCLNYMQILDRCVNFAQSNPACKFAASFDT